MLNKLISVLVGSVVLLLYLERLEEVLADLGNIAGLCLLGSCSKERMLGKTSFST